MPDYNKTVIYKFVCNDLSVVDVYVGHTTNFRQRKSQHKKSCHNEKHRDYKHKLYVKVRDNGGWENWEMIEIEKYSCADANEARARERYFYEELNANLNSQRPLTTKEERTNDHKATHKAAYKKDRELYINRAKLYAENNKEKIKEYKKLKHPCICGDEYTTGHKTRHCASVKHMKFMETNIANIQIKK